jgi:prepilin-type N-terminal cleavage/methylation domain-containing protein
MRFNSRGFTLLELIVVITMIVILATVGLFTYSDALPGMRVKAAARELFGNLHRARITALSTSTTVNVTLNAAGSAYTVGSETIPMGTENPGVRFGAVVGTPPWDATRGLDDGVAIPADAFLPVDQFSIDRRGRPSKNGEIYLISQKDLAAGRTDRMFCIAISQIGTYRLLRYNNATGWQ